MSFIFGGTGGDGVIRRKLAAVLNERGKGSEAGREGGSGGGRGARSRGRSTMKERRRAALLGGPISLIDLSSIIGETESVADKEDREEGGREGGRVFVFAKLTWCLN